MRAFIAVEVPEATRAGMSAVQDRLRGDCVDARWSRPEAVHLTLKFLGELGAERVPGIMEALTRGLGSAERFRLRAEGVGTFPSPAAARVVWVGIGGDVARLAALQDAVEAAMAGLGIEREPRPYRPHLTLGRVRRVRRRDAWLKRLEELRDLELPGFDVAAVSLVESVLGPSGAAYRELGRVALNAVPE